MVYGIEGTMPEDDDIEEGTRTTGHKDCVVAFNTANGQSFQLAYSVLDNAPDLPAIKGRGKIARPLKTQRVGLIAQGPTSEQTRILGIVVYSYRDESAWRNYRSAGRMSEQWYKTKPPIIINASPTEVFNALQKMGYDAPEMAKRTLPQLLSDGVSHITRKINLGGPK
jgi:hypothetical protein